jgi:hypothetical protein
MSLSRIAELQKAPNTREARRARRRRLIAASGGDARQADAVERMLATSSGLDTGLR